MTAPLAIRRATLLGVAIVVSACDIAEFVSDPMPRFEQTWNLPATSSAISVAELLPTDSSVSILPDSSGFALRPSNVTVAPRLGAGCTPCELQNGTTGIKPAFRFTSSSSQPFATDVVSARILSGAMTLTLTNNLTFDPLKVRATGTQGHLVIVVHSGSLVLARDSVDGSTNAWAPGTQIVRNIALSPGDAQGSLTVDVTIDSPQGDAPVPMNADRTIQASAATTQMHAPVIGLQFASRAITSDETDLDLDGLDEFMTRSVTRGAIVMTITNPFAINGNLDLRLVYDSASSGAVTKSVAMPMGNAQTRTVTLTESEMDLVLGTRSVMTFGGNVAAPTPIIVGPRQKITIDNRLQLILLVGGGQ